MDEIINTVIEKLDNSKKGYLSYEELYRILEDSDMKKEIEQTIKKLEKDECIFSKGELFYPFPKQYRVGQIECTRKKTNFIMDDTNEKIYIDDTNLNGALPYDTVIYEIDMFGKAVIKKILERKSPNIVCEVRETFGVYDLVPKNVKGRISLKVNPHKLKEYGAGSFVLVKLDNEQKKGFFSGEIIKKIELNGSIDDSLALIAMENDFDPEFPINVLEEAKHIPETVSQKEIEERKENDFRDEVIFTIDGADTKDMDDAISLKKLPNGNYELGVHIANVSHYVKKGMAIFEEAQKRSTSLYMLNTVIPMLPEILSNGICSLNPNVDRLTKSVIMEIDHSGKVVDSRICDSVIKSKKKMAYEDVNKILEQDDVPEDYKEYETVLRQMNKLSKILSAKRKAKGQISFASNEKKISLDAENNPLDIKKREQLAAETLIENFMVLANETVAEYVSLMEYPFVYRVHQGPNKMKLEEAVEILTAMGYKYRSTDLISNPRMIQKVLDEVQDEEEYPVLSQILLCCMARAKYAPKNEGHFALASNAYTHFTSPIRRFPDLMVHTLLDYYNNIALGNEEFNLQRLKDLELELELMCAHSSRKERQADTAENEADKAKIIDYMKDKIGTKFEAVITMVSERYINIATDDGINGTILYQDILNDTYQFSPKKFTAIGRNTKTKYKIGHKVEVTLTKINTATGDLLFTLDKNLTKKIKSSDYVLKKN